MAHRAGCNAKSPLGFFDPVDGGTCWACPPGYGRYAFSHIKSGNACSSHGKPWARAKLLGKPNDCDPKKREFFDPIDGGTCWTCPPQYDRAWNHVKSKDACYNSGIVWKTIPLPSYGLEQFPGSGDVVKKILEQPNLITAQLEHLGKTKKLSGARLEKFIADKWSAIASDPMGDDTIQAMVYLAMIGSTTSKAPSPKIKQLVQAFERYIRDYDVYLAQDALNAYDAWKRSDDYKKAQRIKKGGMNMGDLMDFGTPPPDFFNNVKAVLGVVALPAAAMGTLAATAAFSSAATGVATGVTTSVTTTTVSFTKISLFALFGGTSTHAVTSGGIAAVASGAALAAAPFAILGGIAISQFVDIVTARPKLEKSLAIAKRGVSFKKLMESKEGQQRATMYWRLAANGGKERRRDISLRPVAAKAYKIWQSGGQPIVLSGATGRKYRKLPGKAAFHLGKNGTIWRQQGSGWSRVNGPKAHDIGANGDHVYMLGEPRQGNDYSIYKLQGSKWQKMPGAAVRIAVDANGAPWVLNSGKKIFAFAVGKWHEISGLGLDIGIGPAKAAAVVGSDAAIWVRDPKTSKWASTKLKGMAVSVGAKGGVWFINDKNDIYAEVR
jgi:hypothetical protein